MTSPAAAGSGPTRVQLLVVVLGGLLTVADVGASTLHLYGAGARSIGLAGAHEAVAADYLATWANPANLAFNRGVHFGLGTHMLSDAFAIDRVAGATDWPSRYPGDLATGHLGVSSPIGGVFADRLGIGIHLHIPMSAPTRIASRDHRTPQVAIYDAITNRLVIAMALGGRVLPWLSVGAGFQLLAALDGRADFSLSVLDRRFTKRSLHIDLFSAISPLAGITIHPGDAFRFSLVWRSEAHVRYDLPVRVTVEQVGVLGFRVRGVGLYTPDQLVAAVSHRLGERWLITAAATWARWSKLPAMAPTVDLEMVDEQPADGRDAAELLVVRNRPIAMAAADIVEPRVGAECRLSDALVARAGVRWRPTALPQADGSANYLDSPALTVAAGVGWSLIDAQLPERSPLRIDLGLGLTRLSRRTVYKRDPLDPVVGTSLHGYNVRLALNLHHDF